MPPPSDPRNLRAKWQRALEERRKAGAAEAPPLDVTPAPARQSKGTSRSSGLAAAPKPEPERSAAPREEAPLGRAATTREEAAKKSERAAAPAKDDAREAAKKDDGPKDDGSKNDGPKDAKNDGPKDAKNDGPKKAAAAGSSIWSSVGAAVVLVGGVGIALRTFLGPEASPSADDTTATGTTTATMEPDLPLVPERAPVKSRCADLSKQPFVIGDAPAPKPASTATDADDAPEDDLAPFAVELGRGVPFGAGFAVGTQRQAEGGTVSMVATLGANAEDGKLVRLARSRGDFDPPVVTAAGSSLLAAMMEPNAGGRAIRIAKIEGDRVTWGPELAEGRDESLALDLAATGPRAIVVWDDVPAGHERSVIDLATFDVATMRGSGGRAITPPTIDADQPRLAPRPGGYWLSYMVHGDAPTEPTAAKDDAPDDAGAKPKAGKKGDSNPDDSDTEAAGEAIAHQWLELIPLDDSGMATGAPRAVTPKDGRVIGYDLEDGEDGRAVLLYREDDTPNGSNGGRVKVITVELGGASEPHVIAEEGVGAGVPQLFASWVVIHSMSGPVKIGAIGPHGEMAAELAPEKPLGHGEVIAASGDNFLIATPAGRAMKLSVTRCAR